MAKPTRDDALLILRAQQQAAMSKTPSAFAFAARKDFNGDYKKFIKDHPPGSAMYTKATKIAIYYEGLGTMWKHGLINEDLLFDWFYVHGAWDRMKGFVLGGREAAGEPRLGENFEAMAKASAAWGKKPAARRLASDAAARTRSTELRGKVVAGRTRVPAGR
jgi:hypothetical protein